MKLLNLNIRGLQKAMAVMMLIDNHKCHDMDVIFLMESHLEEWLAECLRRRLKMDYNEVAWSDGRNSGPYVTLEEGSCCCIKA
jgi:hypothetical protein